MNAIVVTFVFSVYLTGTVGAGLPGATTPPSWLGRALALAGLVVAVLAPVTGVWVDAPCAAAPGAGGADRVWRSSLTAAMSLIRDDYRLPVAGLGAAGVHGGVQRPGHACPTTRCCAQLSTPETSGRISGFGSAAGYFGSVLLLLLVYVGFIVRRRRHPRAARPPGRRRSATSRAAMLLAAAWFALFALPLLFIAVPHASAALDDRHSAVGFFGAYRKLWAEVVARVAPRPQHRLLPARQRDLPRRAGRCVHVRRGARRQRSYGISQADVLLFGVSACVIAAVGAVLGGLLDDRRGLQARHRRLAGRDDRRRH